MAGNPESEPKRAISNEALERVNQLLKKKTGPVAPVVGKPGAPQSAPAPAAGADDPASKLTWRERRMMGIKDEHRYGGAREKPADTPVFAPSAEIKTVAAAAPLFKSSLSANEEEDVRARLGEAKKGLESDFSNPLLLIEIATCLGQLGEWEEAKGYYLETLEHDPDNPLALRIVQERWPDVKIKRTAGLTWDRYVLAFVDAAQIPFQKMTMVNTWKLYLAAFICTVIVFGLALANVGGLNRGVGGGIQFTLTVMLLYSLYIGMIMRNSIEIIQSTPSSRLVPRIEKLFTLGNLSAGIGAILLSFIISLPVILVPFFPKSIQGLAIVIGSLMSLFLSFLYGIMLREWAKSDSFFQALNIPRVIETLFRSFSRYALMWIFMIAWTVVTGIVFWLGVLLVVVIAGVLVKTQLHVLLGLPVGILSVAFLSNILYSGSIIISRCIGIFHAAALVDERRATAHAVSEKMARGL